MTLQIATYSLNLCPPNPTFLQARDEIWQADLMDNGAANYHELWAAFARRGMGASAAGPSSGTTVGVYQAFDLPDDLVVTPRAEVASAGPVAGPFNPTTQGYILTNVGSGMISWTATRSANWLTISNESGTMAAGAAAARVNVSLNNKASLLPQGIY